MRYKDEGKLAKIKCGVFTFAVILAISCAALYIQLTKHMAEICEYKGRQTARKLVNNAIEITTSASAGDYLDISYGEDGKITSISADVKKINSLETKLKDEINTSLAHIEDNEMGVPIGTLTGITYFSGRGPELSIKLHQIGAVDTELISEFESAGMNQTKHSLKIKVKAELSAILPAHSTDIMIEDEYLIGETIIVGEVPQRVLSAFDLSE